MFICRIKGISHFLASVVVGLSLKKLFSNFTRETGITGIGRLLFNECFLNYSDVVAVGSHNSATKTHEVGRSRNLVTQVNLCLLNAIVHTN